MSGHAGPVHRPLEPEDAGTLAALWGSPEVNPWIAWAPGEDALPTLQQDDGGRWLGAWVGEQLVGAAHLTRQRPDRRRHTCLLDWTHLPAYAEAGEALLAAAVRQADLWMHCTRLEAVVHADDTERLQTLGRHGFAVEVRQRRALRRGDGFVDACAMARLLPGASWPAAGALPAAAVRTKPAARPPVTFRPLVPDDAAAMARINNADSVCYGTLHTPWGNAASWRELLQRQDPRRFRLGAVCTEQLVGSAALFGSSGERARHVWSLVVAVEDGHQGSGVGTALLRELLRVADSELNALRLELEVYSDNPRAVALYRAHGFEVEGERRAESWRAGGYANVLSMSRLRAGTEAP